jgi:hypothetical protein
MGRVGYESKNFDPNLSGSGRVKKSNKIMMTQPDPT